MDLEIVLDSMSGIKSYLFNYLENVCQVNGENVDKDARKIYAEIMNLLREWPKELENKDVVDGMVCNISYREKGQDIKHIYKNQFPENFDELLNLLEGVENAW